MGEHRKPKESMTIGRVQLTKLTGLDVVVVPSIPTNLAHSFSVVPLSFFSLYSVRSGVAERALATGSLGYGELQQKWPRDQRKVESDVRGAT